MQLFPQTFFVKSKKCVKKESPQDTAALYKMYFYQSSTVKPSHLSASKPSAPS